MQKEMKNRGILSLHEEYRLEGEIVQSGKSVQDTMIFPFLKMLENHCEGISAMKLHEILWQAYEKNTEMEKFLKKAADLVQPYLKQEEPLG